MRDDSIVRARWGDKLLSTFQAQLEREEERLQASSEDYVQPEVRAELQRIACCFSPERLDLHVVR